MIRVLLVDDQPIVRGSLAIVLGAEPDLEVVAEAADGDEAVVLAARLAPDVVLMDIRMPVLDGVAAAAEITRQGLLCRVLLMTTFDAGAYRDEALAAGAEAVLLKDAPPGELVAAIRAQTGTERIIATP